ncbi:hypothetical protein A3780_20355 [Kosakonia radicincitans]|nr:hypothetical protein A3780_20355 [Kosakonia radicincitans]PTA88971.1 hypothetical protein CWM66_21190 [Kosakonia sp. H7A]
MSLRMKHLAAGLLLLLPVLAVLQSGPPRPGRHPVVRPLQALMRPPASELHALTVTLTTATHQVRVQGVTVPTGATLPGAPQDTVYSLDPQRDGHGPLSFPVLLDHSGGHHA